MSHIIFWVDGKPAGYDRGAAVKRFTPPEVALWRQAIVTAYRMAAPHHWPREGEYADKVSIRAEVFGALADVDNLLKEVQDALTGHAYRDDSQVIEAAIKVMDRELTESGKPRKYKTGKQGMRVVLHLYGVKGAA